MKLIAAFALLLGSYAAAQAQQTIAMRIMWERPQVHVLCNGYTLSFTIRDINRALQLRAQAGDSSMGTNCGLDPAGDYIVDLNPDAHMQYVNPMQRIMQNGVGVFLLHFGKAYIKNPRGRKVMSIVSDRQTFGRGTNESYYIFSDPKKHKEIFTGKMIPGMKDMDLGIDY